jgi:hypothetical protein
MNITKEQWQQWRQSEVTKEWFELFRYRQQRYEELIPALIATGTDESINQARVASGRHQELEDLLQTDYEDMK